MSDAGCEVVTKVKIRTDIKEPPKFSVVLLNDNATSVDFVIQLLMDVFSYGFDEAAALTMQIDQQGSGVAASGLSKELATHLRDLCFVKAEAAQFPLQTEIREEK
ncbi:ATP-dependent Clp protease adapter protein ClpS [uncultured archaeon]|nr:ATP-dependent Clp protease adapter protein ClpS [uncultured archaeon]